jgi:hypothetical protein
VFRYNAFMLRSRRDWFLFILLVLAAILFRVPAILNAPAMSSDATVVGLQAQHILRGEWSRFLWGAGYQSSLDAYLAALVFLVAGANPWSLMAVPLLGHLLLIACAFAILRRRVGAGAAFVLCLALAWTPRAVNSVTVYPPRQWSITTMFVALWLFDRASLMRRPALILGCAAFMSIMALYLDLFSLQMMVGVAVFAVLCCWDAPTEVTTDLGQAYATRPATAEVLRRLGGCVAGLVVGCVAFVLLRRGPESTAHTTTLAFDRLPQNLVLLWETCLPWLLGVKVFIEREVVWQPPTMFRLVQVGGAVLLVAGIVAGGLALSVRSIPWPVRRLGVLGAVIAASSLGGFAVSAMPADQYSSRYLAPIIWAIPFALAPVCFVLGRRRFMLAFAPYLIAAAVSGWLSFGPFVQGATPVLAPRGAVISEERVRNVLEARGIRYAAADYWFAYRLTFLWNEQIVVVPLQVWQDRYPPYRRGFDAASTVAYLFHPSQPQANPYDYAAQLTQRSIHFERLIVDDWTLLITR